MQGVGSLMTLYDNLDKVPALPIRGAKTLPKKLEEHRDQAFLSYQLATIKVDCTLNETFDALTLREPDKIALAEQYRALEFKGWLLEILDSEDAPAEITAETTIDRDGYVTIMDDATLDDWLKRLANAGLFAFDTETTSLDYMQAELVGVSFAITPGEAAYLPVAHDYPGAPDQLDRDAALKKLKPLLEDPALKKIGQNLKYDMSVLAKYDITLRGVEYDTMLELSLIHI